MIQFDPVTTRIALGAAAVIGAVSLALLRPSGAGPRRTRSVIPALACAIGGLGIAGCEYLKAGNDLRAFDADPACRAGFARGGDPHGLCRIETVSIRGLSVTPGRNRHRDLELVLPDGSRRNVRYASDEYGSVWRGARDAGDRDGWAETFRGEVVAVETHSGVADTSAMPAQRFTSWALAGMIAGASGTCFALLEAFRSRA